MEFWFCGFLFSVFLFFSIPQPAEYGAEELALDAVPPLGLVRECAPPTVGLSTRPSTTYTYKLCLETDAGRSGPLPTIHLWWAHLLSALLYEESRPYIETTLLESSLLGAKAPPPLLNVNRVR